MPGYRAKSNPYVCLGTEFPVWNSRILSVNESVDFATRRLGTSAFNMVEESRKAERQSYNLREDV